MTNNDIIQFPAISLISKIFRYLLVIGFLCTHTFLVFAGVPEYSKVNPEETGAGDEGENAVLKVEIAQMSALEVEGAIELNWITASEPYSDYFIIEKSLDGKVFHEIDLVLAAGNSAEMRDYYILDEFPFAGTSYYRITQVDQNGNRQEFEKITAYARPLDAIKFMVESTISRGNDLNITIDRYNQFDELKLEITNKKGKIVYDNIYPMQYHDSNAIVVPYGKWLRLGYYVLMFTSKSLQASQQIQIN